MDTIQEIMADINDRRILSDEDLTVHEIDTLLLQFPANTFLLFIKMALLVNNKGSDPDEIEQHYTVVCAAPEDTYTTLARGEYYEEIKKDYEKVFELYNKAIEQDEENTNFWAYLYLSHFFYNILEYLFEAQRVMIQAYPIFMGNPLIILQLAELYVDTAWIEKTAEELLYEIPERYRFGRWYRTMAFYKMYRKKFEEAYKFAEQLRIIEPNTLEPYFMTLFIMQHENKYTEMRELCDTISVKYPNSYQLIYHKGIAEIELGNYTEAEQLLTKSLELSGLPRGDCLYIHSEMIILYLKMGLVEKARTYFEENLAEYKITRLGRAHSLLIAYLTSQEDFQREREEFSDYFLGIKPLTEIDELFVRLGLKILPKIYSHDGKMIIGVDVEPMK